LSDGNIPENRGILPVIVAESEMIEKITFEAFYDREMNPAPSGQPITAWK